MSCGYNERMTFDCVDGYLHDMDYDYVDETDKTYPCPKCNRVEFFIQLKEEFESSLQEPGWSQWENLVGWYCDTFSIERQELYDLFKEVKELNYIKIDQGYNDRVEMVCKHDYSDKGNIDGI